MKKPTRKQTRLKDFDYSQNGAYFITICSENMDCIFGKIKTKNNKDDAYINIDMELTSIGEIVRKHIKNLTVRYPSMALDNYVIMPNHVHLLITIQNEDNVGEGFNLPAQNNVGAVFSPPAGALKGSPTISDMIRAMKSLSTREIRQKIGYTKKIFQRSFHDHVITKDKEYDKIWDYIDGNPYQWIYDRYYVEQ